MSINGADQSLATAEFTVNSDLQGKADTCRIALENQDGAQGEAIAEGDALEIEWGYEGGDLTKIF